VLGADCKVHQQILTSDKISRDFLGLGSVWQSFQMRSHGRHSGPQNLGKVRFHRSSVPLARLRPSRAHGSARAGGGIDDSEAMVPLQRRSVAKRGGKLFTTGATLHVSPLVVGTKIANRAWSFEQPYVLSGGKTLASDFVNHTASKGLNT
jgi:hypothetical protein